MLKCFYNTKKSRNIGYISIIYCNKPLISWLNSHGLALVTLNYFKIVLSNAKDTLY